MSIARQLLNHVEPTSKAIVAARHPGMASLTIHCPLECDRALRRLPTSDLVFKTVCLFEGDPQPDYNDLWQIDRATDKDFFNEAAAYADTLLELQGIVVPRFYGSFQTRIGGKISFCTVTQYWGEPLKGPLYATPEFKNSSLLINCMHTKPATATCTNKIIDKDGHPILDKTAIHKCERRMGILQGAIAPDPIEFGFS
ncbi:hypothetical protein FB451DRAFT_1548457 [Mycena latifolia]|nr:hypothetical protein FB451DRAFT_1548457 [Mycena latifolia]